MKLSDVYISVEKLKEYCLNNEHSEGKHKARIFKTTLDIDENNVEELVTLLEESCKQNDAEFIFENRFGKHYRIDYEVQGLFKKEMLRSFWMIPQNTTEARLISCFIHKKKKLL
ncbi:MAG: hypothetical protein KGZ58_12800 [Ignavibacteriales bacterium]|nr:hypothetical protein [Ignavibacteriales bacterium]